MKPRASDGWGETKPPQSFIVETQRRPILYTAAGVPLANRPIGFDTKRDDHGFGGDGQS
jgi:hypothetical protein